MSKGRLVGRWLLQGWHTWFDRGIDHEFDRKISAKYADFDGEEWLKRLNNSTISIGEYKDGFINPDFIQSFIGTISCLQLYSTALNEAEVQIKKNCNDADRFKTPICPENYFFIAHDNMCYRVYTSAV